MKFILKASILNMLYKQDNSGKKIYWRNLHGGKFTEWNNFKSGTSNLATAGENSHHFVAPSMVYPWNDVWETSAEIPYWWHATSQIWVSTFDWLKICFIQSEVLPDPGSDALSV